MYEVAGFVLEGLLIGLEMPMPKVGNIVMGRGFEKAISLFFKKKTRINSPS